MEAQRFCCEYLSLFSVIITFPLLTKKHGTTFSVYPCRYVNGYWRSVRLPSDLRQSSNTCSGFMLQKCFQWLFGLPVAQVWRMLVYQDIGVADATEKDKTLMSFTENPSRTIALWLSTTLLLHLISESCSNFMHFGVLDNVVSHVIVNIFFTSYFSP